MTIAIRGRPLDQGLRTRVVQQLRATLGRLAVEPVAAQATFFYENGPKGGVALRCALTVRLPYRPPIRVEETAINARLAFDGSFAKLERELTQYRERDRERTRHPKKYYAARRLVSSETRNAATKPAPRRARAPARQGMSRRRV